ncbi:hypothetical protein RvY_07623 [Ramazzottius varieornatus]|uniref:AN1-type domain-containing protein n=1 Tax=Ramazzottius varieornatus TaxID=947166 RepID=A0A1D1V5W0_RAMVA|nr:hypothetical protein RvY_07623 [Ramazzottius varieornatus]
MARTPKDVFHAGEYCSVSTCNRLDFLPVKCDGCSKKFCNDHFRYEQHQCLSGRLQDNQVPVCPLCSKPVPVKKGEVPDIRVGQHIDADCPSETAVSKRKVFENRCSAKGCKKKEMMRVECTNCRKTFCLAHRFPDDHSCQGAQVTESGGVSNRSGAAAMARIAALARRSQPEPSSASSKPKNASQNPDQNLSQDEQLARALQMSMAGISPSSQEEEDLALAQALAMSEAEYRNQPQKKTNCVMS